MLNEFLTETILADRQREIAARLQRQAVLDYLRQDGAAAPGALRLSAHWLGVRLERIGVALQADGGDPLPEMKPSPVAARRHAPR